MKALIAEGGVSLDEDSWWVCDATGELIGPDPDLERPLTDKDFAKARPLNEVGPSVAKKNTWQAKGRFDQDPHGFAP